MRKLLLLLFIALVNGVTFKKMLKKMRNNIYEFKMRRDSFVQKSEQALEDCEIQESEFCDVYDETMSESFTWWFEEFKPKMDDFFMKFFKKKPKTKEGVLELERWKQFYFYSKAKGRSMSNAWEVRGKNLHEAEMWFWLEWHLEFLSWNLEEDGIEETQGEDKKLYYVVHSNTGEYYFDITNRDLELDWDLQSLKATLIKKQASELKRKAESPPPPPTDELPELEDKDEL